MTAKIIPLVRTPARVPGSGSGGDDEQLEGELADYSESRDASCQTLDPSELRRRFRAQIWSILPNDLEKEVRRNAAPMDLGYCVGVALSEARQQAGVSQAELRLASGLSVTAVQGLEAGGGSLGPRMETVRRYIEALDVELVFQLRVGRKERVFVIAPSDPAEEISANLAVAIRRLAERTQADVESVNKWAAGYVSRLEGQGKRRAPAATLGTIFKLASACGTEISLLAIRRVTRKEAP